MITLDFPKTKRFYSAQKNNIEIQKTSLLCNNEAFFISNNF